MSTRRSNMEDPIGAAADALLLELLEVAKQEAIAHRDSRLGRTLRTVAAGVRGTDPEQAESIGASDARAKYNAGVLLRMLLEAAEREP